MTIAAGPIASAPIAAEPDSEVPVLSLSSAMAIGASIKIQPDIVTLGSSFQTASVDAYGAGKAFKNSLQMASSVDYERSGMFVSKLAAASFLDTNLNGNISLSSAIEMLSVDRITHVLQLVSTMQLGGAADIEHAKVLAFLTSLQMGSSYDTQANLVADLAAAMTIRSLETYGWDFDAVSAVQLAAAFESRYNTVFDAVSALQLGSAESTDRQLGMVFISTAEATSSYDTQADLHMDFFDALEGQVVFKLGDDVYQGWVFSTQAAAFTEYSSYPFNSMAMYKEKPYGLSDDGIYLLEGADDDGNPIDAAVKTKLSALRERAIKDARAAYVGYTSDGDLVLKVSTVKPDGTKREDWYKAQFTGDAAMRTNRMKIQRGLRSTYWQFELANQNGADFEIEDVTIMYEVLSRRIR